jgi:hypothetical protein
MMGMVVGLGEVRVFDVCAESSIWRCAVVHGTGWIV